MAKKHENHCLTDRAQQVLTDVVNAYSHTGQPVGSKALVEQSRLNLSPASIRNVMQDLEKQGLLTHPHTSAGRIPTEEGFRYYAQTLAVTEADLNATLKKELQSAVHSGKNIDAVLKDVSNTLGEITGCAGLVTAPKHMEDPLEQLEFIRLSGDRVLAIMVTKNGTIENRVIEVPAFIETEDLNKSAKQLHKIIAGQTLDVAREQLVTSLAEQRGRVNEMLDQMMTAANEWGQPVISDGAMVVAGSTNLFQYPELVREKLQGLVKMFEEKRLLISLMEEVKHGEGVQIYIGKDCDLTKAEDLTSNCAMVAAPYTDPTKSILGTLGVIGPMRMDYKQAIGVVNYTGQLLGNLLTQKENA